MSVEELVQAFEHSNKKANDIRVLANKFNISEREVIETLKSFNIKTPRIVGRGEVIEFDDNKMKEIKTELELDDSDITPAISIMKKFEEMSWTKKEGIERIIQLSYYVKTKLELDCFKIYTSVLEYIIKNSGVKKLEQDIDSIQNGNRFNVTEKPEKRIMNTLLRVADDLLDDLLEPENEPEAKPTSEKTLLVKVYQVISGALGK